MAVVEVKLKDFAKVFRKYGKDLEHEMKQEVVRATVRAIPRLVRNSPVDTGEYAASWSFNADEEKVILGNFAPHAPIIEFGARPFRPPLGPLIAWAKRVLQDPGEPPSKRVMALAVGTQKKIEKHGMMPKALLRQEIPRIIQDAVQSIERMAKGPPIRKTNEAKNRQAGKKG